MNEIFIGNMKEEVINGFIVSEKRKAIWNVELGLLKKLDEVCKKHSLRYWLDSGTLLGAIRHQGFIPWDDDIDVVMPRKDYDKLYEISKEEFCYPYFYQNIYSENNYPGILSKLRDCRTTAISKNWLFNDINQGIFIDVLPLDGVPNSKQEFDDLTDIASKKAKNIRFYYEYDRILSLKPQVIKTLSQRRNHSRETIGNSLDYVNAFREYENLFRKYDYETSTMVGTIAFTLENKRQLIYSRECFNDTLYLNFEKLTVPVPIGYDEILKSYYGSDYMTPRKVKIYLTPYYFDPSISYRKHLEKLRKEYSLLNRIKKEICSIFDISIQSEYERKLLSY